jgi:hypothetical protein
MLTYAYPAWPAVPYLSVAGPDGSGKSRLFDVLAELAYRPLVSSNMTAPSLFRTLHTRGGTLLLDEAERLRERTAEIQEIKSVLLAGYKAGGQAQRMEKVGETFRTCTFGVYGPKAIAGINELPPALASRCVRVTMFRAAKDSPKPKRRIAEKSQEFARLTDELHAFALTNGPTFIELTQDFAVCEDMLGRDMEVWQPILVLAKFLESEGAEGLLEHVRNHADSSLAQAQQEAIPEADEVVLRLLCEMMDQQRHGVTAGDILSRAKSEHEMLFKMYSAKGIGNILGRYGIKSDRSGGKRLFRPSDQQLTDIQNSYGIALQLEDEKNDDKSGSEF